MQRRGLWIAMSALSVSAPRLSMAFLQADGIRLSSHVEAGLVAVTGVATAIVLTGGNMYLAHSIADERTRGGWYKFVLACAWLAELIFSVILIAPSLANALQASSMNAVLASTSAQWTWSVTAVLAVEMLAAAAMVADAAHRGRPASGAGGDALSKLATIVAVSLERRLGVAQATQASDAAAQMSTAAGNASDAASQSGAASLSQSLATSPQSNAASLGFASSATASVASPSPRTAERLLPCPNAIRGCTWTGRPAQVGPHVQYHCQYKKEQA